MKSLHSIALLATFLSLFAAESKTVVEVLVPVTIKAGDGPIATDLAQIKVRGATLQSVRSEVVEPSRLSENVPFFVVVDELAFTQAELARLQPQLLRLLASFEKQNRPILMAVFDSGGLKLIHQFPVPGSIGLMALSEYNARHKVLGAGFSSAQKPATEREVNLVSAELKQLEQLNRVEYKATGGSSRAVWLDGIRQIAQGVARAPGRKPLMLIEGEFPMTYNAQTERMTLGGHDGEYLSANLQATVNSLNAAHVSVFWTSNVEPVMDRLQDWLPIQTGGEAVRLNGDVEAAASGILAGFGKYQMLHINCEVKPVIDWHPISVKTATRGVRIASGFFTYR